MNCRRIKELIPLFIEGDLEAESIKHVTLHLSGCETCSGLLGEYKASQSWFGSQTPPEFDDAFYMDLQQSVMRKIKRPQPRPAFFHQLKAGFRLNPSWAMAIGMLILVGAFAFYLYSSKTNRNSNPEQFGLLPEPKEQQNPQEQKENQPQPQEDKKNLSQKFLVVKNPRKRSQREKNLKLNLPPMKQNQAKDNEFVAKENLEKDSINTGETVDARLLEEMTRMEFQTSDPNIRIIWFAPKLNSSPSIKIDTE